MDLFKELTDLAEPKKNFKNYRQSLSERLAQQQPCIPFLGVILSDFTFLDDGNSSEVEGDLINFVKVFTTVLNMSERRVFGRALFVIIIYILYVLPIDEI